MKKLIIILLLFCSIQGIAQSLEDRTTLKGHFETGDTPTQGHFESLINSVYNLVDDIHLKRDSIYVRRQVDSLINVYVNESQIELYINGDEASFTGWDKDASNDYVEPEDSIKPLTYASNITMDYDVSSNAAIQLTGHVNKLTVQNVPESKYVNIELKQLTGGYGVDTIYNPDYTTYYLPGVAPDSSHIDTTQGRKTLLTCWASDSIFYVSFTAVQRDTLMFIVPFTADSTDLTVTALQAFRMPASSIVKLRASVDVAPTGSAAIFDLKENGSSILSTLINIDATETDSNDSGTSYVISDSSIAEFSKMSIHCTQIGSSTAGKGGELYIYYIKN
jgi:hypothetical protein